MPAGSSGHATPPQPPTPTLGAGTPPAAPAGCLPALSLPQLYPPLQLPPPATSRCLPGMGPAVFLRHLQMCMKDPGPGVKTANRASENVPPFPHSHGRAAACAARCGCAPGLLP